MENRIQQARRAHRAGNYSSLTRAAAASNVPRSTLTHRLAGRQSRMEVASTRHKLYDAEELVLVEWIKQLYTAGLPPRIALVTEMANHLFKKRVQEENNNTTTPPEPIGKNWVCRFTHRHKDLKSVYGRQLNMERFLARDEELFGDWFESWKKVMDEHQVLRENTYNMDEKRCMLGIAESAEVLIPTAAKSRFIQQPGTRESVTIIECVNARGDVLPPFIIWAAKTHRNNWYPFSLSRSPPSLPPVSMATPITNLGTNGFNDVLNLQLLVLLTARNACFYLMVRRVT